MMLGNPKTFLLGRTERQTLALAMETDLDRWMSTDPDDGGENQLTQT
jgi:hypothetical protein